MRTDDAEHLPDVRIRMELGLYRVVAPNAKRSGRCDYLNDSKLIIEKQDRDSLGTSQWRQVGEIRHPGNRTLLAQDPYNGKRP